ncbi:MAG: methyltransferase domain-containing protein [Sandaracinaceae bacterium]
MDRSAYDKHLTLEERHFWRVTKRRLVRELIERHGGTSRPLRLCDIGGASSLLARDLGTMAEVIVVEPDPAMVELARERLGLDARVGALPGPLPEQPEYDVVTLLDVLEHLDDDFGALEAIRSQLRPGGILVLTVPALPELWSSHDEILHHRRRYRRADVVRLLERAGFEVERATYWTGLLLGLVAAQRWYWRRQGGPPTYRVEVPSAPVNWALSQAMNVERRLLSHVDLPIGSSLAIVARVPASRAAA